MTFFLKIPIFISADIIASLCGVCVRVRVNNFSSKQLFLRKTQRHAVFLKDTLSIEDDKS